MTHCCFNSLIVLLLGSILLISAIEFCMSARPRCSAWAFISDVEDEDDTWCIDDVVVELLDEEL